MDFAAVATITAEIALALYPILIKQVDVSLFNQLLARLGTYSVLTGLFSSQADRMASWGSGKAALQSVGIGLMNLVHIAASYTSYKHLPAGTALALFYTYPFLNILAGSLFLGEAFDWKLVPYFLLAFGGVILISKYTTEEGFGKGTDGNGTDKEPKRNVPFGMLMAGLAALTETLIFLVVKTDSSSTPWTSMLKLYPAGLLGLLGVSMVSNQSIAPLAKWVPLLLFNIFVGFLGYSLRFFSIPRLSTAVFSLLTFIGVAAGYGWGLLYANETPALGAILGAGCIVGALGFMGK